MKKRIKNFLKYLNFAIKRPEMEVLPGNLAFFFMMMIIPLLTILGLIISNLDVGTESVYDALVKNFPKNIADLIISISGESSSGIGIFVLLFSSLFLASNGTYSMIVTSNSIYGIKKSSYIKNKIKSIVLIFILVILFTILLFIPMFNNKIINFLGDLLHINTTSNLFVNIYHILKYPVMLILVFIFIEILYKYSSSSKIKKRTIYGAVFSSILLIVVTFIYSFYIDNFSSFENFYGGISSILCLMIYLNLISYIFVLGMSINYARDNYNKDV